MREKMIKVLDVIGSCNAKYCCDCEFAKDNKGCERRQKEIIADHLVANGVTIPVRCKDCDYRSDVLDCGNYLCSRKMIGMVRPNDFCSFGERRTDERKAD